MEIHQFLTSFSYGDAIGNETLEIRNYLKQKGYKSEIFALFYHPKYAGEIINYLEYDKYSSKENIIIYHFSIGSVVTKKFLRLADKKTIIYHNITPYYFFLDYHRILAKDCYKGRIELKNISDKVDLALGDSKYNEEELIQAGYKKTGVLPLVMNFKKFDTGITPVLKELFNDGKTNILFVGRVIPNKRVEDVIKVFYFYKKYFNPASRLFIIGENRGFERYISALYNLINTLEVKDIFFSGHIPDEELISYFKLSHLYLHMSEHEGFCAPVPESFYQNIPVIAFNAGAVKETMGTGGILVNKKSYIHIASIMDKILRDGKLKEKILSKQNEAVKKYFKNRTGEILLDHLQKIM